MKLGKTCIAWGLALASSAVACNTGSGSQPGGGDAATAAAGTASAATAAPSGQATPPKPAHRFHRGGGMFGMLLRGTRDLTLSDAQNDAIGKLDDELHADDATRGGELKALDTDVIAGIRAGKVDLTKVQTDYAAIDAAMQARLAKEATAVNGLYALLDPGQRKQLADGLRAKQTEREQSMKNLPDAGGPDVAMKMRVARLTNELSLDDAQQKQVSALVAKLEPPTAAQSRKDAAKQQVGALLTAFAADGFDANKVPPPGKSLHEGMERDVTFTAQLVSILRPEQREKLATQRERMSMMRARMGAGDSPWGDDSVMGEGLRHPGGPL
jgi:Spy/CpxP family protein refolding chaperone